MVTNDSPDADLRLFRAVADGTRRAILDRLRKGEESTGELAARFTVSRPAISRHLRMLKDAGLIRERQNGRNRIYSLSPLPLQRIDAWLARYRLFWSARLHDLKAFVEERCALDESEGNDP